MGATTASPTFPLVRIARPGLCGLAIVVGDLAALSLAMTAAVLGRLLLGGDFELSLYSRLLPLLLLFSGVYALYGLYPGVTYSAVREIRELSFATTLVFIILGSLTFLFKEGPAFSRLAFICGWALAIFLVPLMRTQLRVLFAHRAWWGFPVVVLGPHGRAGLIVQSLRRNPRLGLIPVALFGDTQLGEALDFARKSGLKRAIVVGSEIPDERLMEAMDSYSEVFSHVYLIPGLPGLSSLGMETKEIGHRLALEIRRSLMLPGSQFVKSMMDGSIALALCIVLLPLMALIALLIRLESPGAALFGHRRIGLHGREFTMWKFRTMYWDGEQILAKHLRNNPEDRQEWAEQRKLRHDPRITRLGRILRKTSLAELPQLWNVLRGEMSLVGPRPIVRDEVVRYGRLFDLYCRVTPGLTGLWQVSGRSETDYGERVDLDTYYVRNWSPWFDFYLLFRTIRVVLKGEGAY